MRRSIYPFPQPSEITDSYFGVEVCDPYRNFENLTDAKTLEWLNAQGQITEAYFSNLGGKHQVIKNHLTSLWQYPKYSVFSKEGSSFFFWGLDLEQSDQIQNQAVLYRIDRPDEVPVSVLDPNLIDATGKSAVTYQSFSRDGSLVAYTVSQNGSDWQTVHIRQTLTLFDYPEKLEGCRAVNIAWKADSSGFFYNRFITPTDTNNSQKEVSCIFWHQLGTYQAEDKLVYFPRNDELDLAFYPETSYDGRYLILYVSRGTAPHNLIYYRETDSSAPFNELISETQTQAQFVYIGNIKNTLFFQTTWNAPKGQIIAIDLSQPASQSWQTIVPEQSDSLAFVMQAMSNLVIGYLHNAYHCLKIYGLEGNFETEIGLPSFSTVSGITAKPDSTELLISMESFISPPTIYRYDLLNGELDLLVKPVLDFQPEEYMTTQVFVTSKDGTRFPVFLTCKKGLCLNGSNPTLLTGYGGFGISQSPHFLISQILWLERGGVLAVANIRGGGEYGLEWHEQGRLANKQNSFTDFQAAANWLITGKYTNPARLAIIGHSNGGLLMAGCTVQAPELFGAVVCQAPVTDMLRYHKAGTGRNWLAEYGCAEADREQFNFLMGYSPLHNIKEADYPAVLVTVPIGDERVHPMHSLKFMAGLQASSTGEQPLLLRVARVGGHGLGNASGQTIEELTDIYTFLFDAFHMF